MKVVEFLKRIASKTGVVRLSDEPPEAEGGGERREAPAIRTRVVSLTELLDQDRKAREKVAAPASVEYTIDFDQIWAALKIEVFAHGWNVERIAKYLDSEHARGLERNAARQALLALLSAGGVDPGDIVRDAVNKDDALDSYEQYTHRKLLERGEQRRREIADLERQIGELGAKIESIRAVQAKDEEAFGEWLQRKVAKEEELVRVVSLVAAEHTVEAGRVTKV